VQTKDGRKKDGSGNPLTKKGAVFSNIDGGNVPGQTVKLVDLKKKQKTIP
jgi:hypothetical protein